VLFFGISHESTKPNVFLNPAQTNGGGVYFMQKKGKEVKQESDKQETAKTGYGDKKLNGPKRPRT
jgi:hypothetical protein